MKVPLRRRIGWRIAGWIALLGFGVTSIAAYLLLTAETRAFRQTAERYLGLVGAMAAASPPMSPRGPRVHPWAQPFPGGVHELPQGVQRLRLFDPDGRIVASNRPEEVGTPLEPQQLAAFQLRIAAPHQGPVLYVTDEVLLPDTYQLALPLRAGSDCARSGCHGAVGEVVGGVEVAVVGDQLHVGMRSFRRVAVGVWIGLLLVVLILVLVMVHALLGRPLDGLARAMERAEAGDFLVRATERGNDELALLSRAFNKLLRRLTDLKVDVVDTNLELHNRLNAQAAQDERCLEEANREFADRLAELELLYDLSRVVSSSLELARVLDVLTQRISERLGIARVAVTVLESSEGASPEATLRVAAAHGFAEPDRILGLEFPEGRGVAWEALRAGTPVAIEDTRDDPRVTYFMGRSRGDGSLAALPFWHRGEPSGVLLLSQPDGSGFDEGRLRLLASVADQVGMAVANARLHEATRTLAITDPLTGLFNRRYLEHRLDVEWERAKRFSQPLSVLMIDIDHFKEFNDANGHLYGDRALKEVARLIRSALRQVDTVARFGGEEFLALLPHTAEEGARQVAEKLRCSVAAAELESADVAAPRSLTISIGLATLRPAPSGPEPDVVDLLEAADRALYRAKREGRDRVFTEPLLPVIDA